MEKVKILHCSDMHFDTVFRELDKDTAENSREELMEVFRKIVDLSIADNVQALLISGDVFDNASINKTTLFFISTQLKRLDNTHVFIAPGNHDPYNEKSFYKIIEWPDNVHIFKGEMDRVIIDDLNIEVWGAAFNSKYVKDGLMNIKSIDNSKINIMVLHGEVVNKGMSSEYNPIYLDEIKKSGMDYIALGHIHKFSGILRAGRTVYAYPGCPQGRGFDEEGEKGVILGDVFKGGAELKFIPINKRKYIVEEIDISFCNNYEDIRSIIYRKLSKVDRENNLFKLVLTGYLKNHFLLNVNTLESKIKKDFYFVKIIDNSRVEVDLEELAQDYSIKGNFVKLMLERLKDADDDEKDILNRALRIGIQCLSEEEVDLDDNQ